MPHAFDRAAFDSVAFDVEPIAATTGGPGRLSRRRVQAPRFYPAPPIPAPFFQPPIAAIALPAGVSAKASLGSVSASGAALVNVFGLTARARLGAVLTIGILDISDEDLIFLLSAA